MKKILLLCLLMAMPCLSACTKQSSADEGAKKDQAATTQAIDAEAICDRAIAIFKDAGKTTGITKAQCIIRDNLRA